MLYFANMASLALSPLLPPSAPEQALMRRAAASIRRMAEDWYIEARQKYGHSRLALELVVLKPICEDCAASYGGRSLIDRLFIPSTKDSEIAAVLPAKTRPKQFRMYDRSRRLLHMWDYESSTPDWWRGPTCSICSQDIRAGDGDGIFVVTEEPFEDYFGLPEPGDAPKQLRGKARKEMRQRIFDLYGGRCFECRKKLRIGKNLTLDHIVAKSRNGGWLPINLQPFCRRCQEKKKDLPVETVVFALDMLLRPAPSDAYDGLVW